MIIPPILPKKPTKDVDKIGVRWLCQLWDCVAYAMKFPIGDGKTTYRSGNAIHAIPQANTNSAATGDTYNGFFKVINTSTAAVPAHDGEPEQPAVAKVKIVNGNNQDAAKCGWSTINDTNFEVDAAELTITGNAFIYLQASYDELLNITDDPTFEQAEGYPEYEENKFKYLIATVSYSDSDDAITGIIQQHNNGAIIGQTFGECG